MQHERVTHMKEHDIKYNKLAQSLIGHLPLSHQARGLNYICQHKC